MDAQNSQVRIEPRSGAWPGFHFVSMKHRIMLLAIGCVVFSTLIVGGYSYLRLRDTLTDEARAGVKTEALLTAQQFGQAYRRISYDLDMIALTPPIQGIIRARKNKGFDPYDGSSIDSWRKRLGTIFAAVMKGNRAYFQIRYIDFGNEGREIVRVDREGDEIFPVEVGALQKKAGEPYFSHAMVSPAGRTAFSKVTYNREQSKLDPRMIPALRGYYPVEDETGERFGFLIINVNYELFLRDMFKSIMPQQYTILFNSAGDYMEYQGADSDVDRPLKVELAGWSDRPVPEALQKVLSGRQRQGFLELDENLAYFQKRENPYEEASSSVGVLQMVPKKVLFASALSTRNTILAIGLGLCVLCIILSLYVARTMIQPLANLSDLVKSGDRAKALDQLPVARPDEIGALSRALQGYSRALLDSERRAEVIVNNVVDGLILIDATGRIEKFNPSCERIFGYRAEEVIGRNIVLLIHGGGGEARQEQLAMPSASEQSPKPGVARELEALRKNGEIIPIELSINVVDVDGQTKFSGVVRDVREKKALERVRKEFIATVSHELRTPLTSVRGALIILEKLLAEKMPEKAENLMDMARRNTERLIVLVNDILDFEKLEAGKMEFDLVPLDLNDELKKAVDLNKSYQEEKKIRFKFDLYGGPVPVLLDEGRLQQILANLISNAVKFSMDENSVIVGSNRVGDRVRFWVEDHGVGISEEDASCVFQPFSQVDGSATRKVGGTGLGLNITKRFVEGMNGRISFESYKDVGTTFWVEFPVDTSATDFVPLLSEAPVQPTHLPGKLNALHLEDDADFSSVLAAGLAEDVTLTQVSCLQEARTALKTQAFDVVLVDIALADDENGLDILEGLEHRPAAVIVLTALDQPVNDPRVDLVLVKSRTLRGALLEKIRGCVHARVTRQDNAMSSAEL